MNAEDLLSKRQGKPLKVLIVDDEENVRNVFRDFCRTSPLFEVATASGGEEAVNMVCDEKFDIVTVDLVMPEMSGLEAIKTIKSKKPHLPVVIVTGNATESLISKAGLMGGCRVLHKPVDLGHFIQELVDLAEEKCG